MNFSYSDNVPANTPESTKRRTRLYLAKGIITKVAIQFPTGCAELAHCTINRGLHQVWPTNPDGNYAADGYVIEFEENYELLTHPYSLDFITWNESTTYSHNLTVWLTILPKKSIMQYIMQHAYSMMVRGQ